MGANSAQASQNSRTLVAKLVRDAIAALRVHRGQKYDEIIRTYEGCNAVVRIFGLGSVTIAVSDGEVYVGAVDKARDTRMLGRGAIYPQTIVNMLEGRITALDAFRTGELVIDGSSRELSKAYRLLSEVFDAAHSQRLQSILNELRAVTSSWDRQLAAPQGPTA